MVKSLFSIFCRCKEWHIINRNLGKVKWEENNTLFLDSLKGILVVFPVFENWCHYYLLVAGYTSTVHKIMGEDLEHVTLAFDLKTSSPAVVYAALSRMSYFDKVVPMLQLRKSHFLTLANVTLYECKKKHLFFGHIFFMIFYSVNVKC